VSCSNCSQLARRIDLLRRVLAEVIGGIRATARFIEDEQDQPTMPRRDLPPAIHTRLSFVADTAEGRN
jgi:hypothetical protein